MSVSHSLISLNDLLCNWMSKCVHSKLDKMGLTKVQWSCIKWQHSTVYCTRWYVLVGMHVMQLNGGYLCTTKDKIFRAWEEMIGCTINLSGLANIYERGKTRFPYYCDGEITHVNYPMPRNLIVKLRTPAHVLPKLKLPNTKATLETWNDPTILMRSPNEILARWGSVLWCRLEIRRVRMNFSRSRTLECDSNTLSKPCGRSLSGTKRYR